MDLISDLKRELDEQKELLHKLEKRARSNKSRSVGKLRVSKRNNTYQYYFREDQSKEYKYVPVSELEKIKQFIQKEYDGNMIKKLKTGIANTERFIKKYHPDSSVVYPDFILLNLRKRKTFIWEHLGLISDGAYATKNLKKLFQYEKNNYILGDKLLISEEAEDISIDLDLVNTKIKNYLL